MQQVAQRDAPDPRESRPPCYSEAILMPRLDGSFASLNELGGGHIKHKRRRRKTEDDSEEVEENVPLRRNRCRSEEVLSMREIVAGSVRPVESQIDPVRQSVRPAEIMTLSHSPQISTRTRPPQTVEEIRNFDRSDNTLERSPYAARKLSRMQSFKSDENSTTPAASQSPPAAIEIHEDHFRSNDKRDRASDSDDSEEFITIRRPESNSSSSGSVVLIHRPTNL